MITYSRLTYGEITREVIMRINEWRTGINYSDYEIKHEINKALREVMSKTLPYKDWAYKTTLPIADSTTLPKDFMKQIRVVLVDPGTGRNVEARYSTPQEFYKSTDNRYVFNSSYNLQPIYTIWGPLDTTGALPESQLIVRIRPTGSTGFMDCYVAPAYIYTDNATINIPYVYEQLVVLSTLLKILSRSGDQNKIMTIQKDYYEEKNKIIKLVEDKRANEKKELDSFVDPVIPRIPPQPEQGEVAKKL